MSEEKKRAYHLHLPERDLELMLMECGDEPEILTRSQPVPGVFVRYLEERGYDVVALRHTKRDPYRKESLMRWERVDPGSLPDERTAATEAHYGPDVELARAYEHDYAGRNV